MRNRADARALNDERYSSSLLRLYPLLGRAGSYTAILGALLSELRQTLGYEGVGLAVMADDGESLLMLDVQGDAIESARDSIMRIGDRYREETPNERFLRIPVKGDAMMEEVAEGSHIVVVEDALTDSRTDKEVVNAIQARTLVNVPLMLAGKVLGALNLGTYGDEGTRPPSAEQLDYLSALANHVAVAMDRVHFLKQRAQAEEALRVSQRKLALHLEQTMLGVIEWDTKLRVMEWNAAAEAIFGYSRDEAIGRLAIDLIIPRATRPGVEGLFRDLLHQEGGEFSTNESVTKDGGTVLCEWVNTPLVDDGGAVIGVMSLVRDITERRRAEEFRIAKEAAEAASIAKSTFLANISHEIRTPMNAILGFSKLMGHDEDLSDRQQQRLGIIDSSGEHLLALINDVLEMSKVEAGRISANHVTFSLRSLLDQLQSLLGLRAQAKGLQLRVHRSDEVPEFVVTDENKLRQILVNLLGNAVKFTDQGSVELRVMAVRDQGSGVHLLFEVEDTGRGIDVDDAERIFQYFEQAGTATEAESGTGLGLAISREFVRLLGGEISVDSRVGVGSVFKFDIHAEKAEAGTDTRGHSERRVAALCPDEPSYRILVADDTAGNRELLVQLLEGVGFSVKAVSDGKQAVEEFEKWGPQLILMDVRMPVMDGYEATRRIRELPGGAEVPIVAVTASVFSEVEHEVFEAGIDDFIIKPFRHGELFAKIATHLGAQYVYAEPAEKTERHPKNFLDEAMMASIPGDLVSRLRQATTIADFDTVLGLVGEVGLHNERAAAALETAARRFDSESILIVLPEGEC